MLDRFFSAPFQKVSLCFAGIYTNRLINEYV